MGFLTEYSTLIKPWNFHGNLLFYMRQQMLLFNSLPCQYILFKTKWIFICILVDVSTPSADIVLTDIVLIDSVISKTTTDIVFTELKTSMMTA